MVRKKMKFGIVEDMDKRPIAKLVQEASKYESSIYFEYMDKKVNAKSIMGMITFISIMNKASEADDMIDILVDGSDENEAMKNLEEYLA